MIGDPVRLVVAVAVLIAVGLVTYVAGVSIERWRSPAMKMLAPYTWEPAREVPRPETRRLAETTLVRRVIDVAAGLAARIRLLPRVAASLEEAAVALRPAEALFFALAGAGLLGMFTLFASGSVVLAFIALVLSGLFPPVALHVRIGRRRRTFQRQLPDVLRRLAGALRSGYSLPQAMQSVTEEAEEPIATELRRAVAQIRLGQAVEVALDEAGLRMKNPDWDIAVGAIRIQREVGGNLAELVNRVADTMVARQRLRGEVRTLTAEGRISAVVLGLLPIGIGLIMYATNPGYISVLFSDGVGRLLLGGSVLLAIVGFFWIRKTVTIRL